jgi:hypothetical protein
MNNETTSEPCTDSAPHPKTKFIVEFYQRNTYTLMIECHDEAIAIKAAQQKLRLNGSIAFNLYKSVASNWKAYPYSPDERS